MTTKYSEDHEWISVDDDKSYSAMCSLFERMGVERRLAR